MPSGYNINTGEIVKATRYNKMAEIDALPRVSQIADVLPNSGLDYWKVEQTAGNVWDLMANPSKENLRPVVEGAIRKVWGNEYDQKEAVDEIMSGILPLIQERISRGDAISNAIARREEDREDMADTGTAIHYVMEHDAVAKPGDLPIELVKTLIENKYKLFKELKINQDGTQHFQYQETVVLNKEYGYAGRVDCYGNEADCDYVLDWKTKDLNGEKPQGRHYYDSWVFQLAAYANGLGIPEARLFSVIIDRQTGAMWPKEWSDIEARWGWKMFLDCHKLFCDIHDWDVKSVLDKYRSEHK